MLSKRILYGGGAEELCSSRGDEVQEPDRSITVFSTREEVTRQENQGIAPV
jgi:hypothetical protein